MAENEETVQKSALEQMNEILIDKEKVIDRKREELDAYMVELKNFEAELLQKTQELQAWQLSLEENEKNLKAKWEELRTFEANLQNTTNQVLQEKVKLEQLNKERLESELKMNNTIGTDKRLDLNSLRSSIGLAVHEPEVLQVSDVKEEVLADEIPELFKELEKEIRKSYPKWSVLEFVKERFCLQNGDKEIRFFDKEPNPEVQIIMFRKNAKTDKRLQSSIVTIERVAPEWHITTEENRVIYVMPFNKGAEASLVLKKCNEFIKNHL